MDPRYLPKMEREKAEIIITGGTNQSYCNIEMLFINNISYSDKPMAIL